MASLQSFNEAVKFYAAYYGRPGDPGGVVFWADTIEQNGGDLSAAVDAFGTSQEAEDLFGEINADTIGDVVDTMYNFLFNRDADEGGKAFYTNGFIAGQFTAASIALDILNGATGTDAIILENKLQGSMAFTSAVAGAPIAVESPTGEIIFNEGFGTGAPDATYAGNDDAAAGRMFLMPINELVTSIPSGTQIDAFLAENIADEGDPLFPEPGPVFNFTTVEVAGAELGRITGDSEVEVDLTGNQTSGDPIVGLDLDGDGVIARDGVENNDPTMQDDGAVIFGIDAYRRDKLNESSPENYTGDITFDGTGFNADGVDTDGTIFLGGLGVDRARGGIGNDFMAGGGVAQGRFGTDSLEGGRNADFFFFSDEGYFGGDQPSINGGSTFDDSAAQDSDWLLFEGSDDNEPFTFFLESGAGPTGEIEHFNASGNLYGFLDGVDVALGENGQVTASGENVGIGSTGQLIVEGGLSNNIIIGGFDNDIISGDEGNDLLFGGDLRYNNNPNTPGIMNDGRDELYGEDGDDNLVLEFDGGVADGGEGNDTFWLTELATGTQTTDEVTTDGTVRIDLEQWVGYGGADVAGTADQTNYMDSDYRLALVNGENVIATGLGGVDYLAGGANDPELGFNNQQNYGAFVGDLDLRGTQDDEGQGGDNILYAAGGDDTIEGRGGNDWLSGGDGLDNFVFANNDGIDVIHRQIDADDDGIQDVDADGNPLFGQDFGTLRSLGDGTTTLFAEFPADVDLTSPNVGVTQFEVTIDGVVFGADLSSADLSGATTTEDLAAILNASYNAQDSSVSVVAESDDIIAVVVERDDAVIGTTLAEGTVIAGTAVGSPFQVNPLVNVVPDSIEQDVLTFAAYQNRSTGELVDDDGTANSFDGDEDLSNYADDYVAHYGPEGTTLAEDQSFELVFGVEDVSPVDEFDASFSTEDIVTVTVNGVAFAVQRGVAEDGTTIDDETADEAMERLADKINASDKHTFAGDLSANYDNGDDTLTINQGNAGLGGEDVFMDTPVVTFQNLSGGSAPAPAQVINTSDHQLFLDGFNGLNGNLNEDNVLFVGNSGVSRAVFATATDEGGELLGSDAVGYFDLGDPDEVINRTAHGHDSLKSGVGDDMVMGLTGDDRVFASLGDDMLDGGKDHFIDDDDNLVVLNQFEADAINNDADPSNDVNLIEDYSDEAIFDGRDFGPGVGFQAVVDAGLITDPADADVLSDGFKVTVTNTLNDDVTVATNFESVRTINGDGGSEGLDTIDLSAVSDAAVADADNAATATGDDDAGVFFSLQDGDIEVTVADGAGGTDFFDEFGGALGFENVVGGDGADEVAMGDSDVTKSNDIDLGGETADGDTVSYNLGSDPGVMSTLVVEAEPGVDTYTVNGPSLAGPVTDTLTDVENLRFLGFSNNSMMDVLDLSNIDGVVLNFANFDFGNNDLNLGESVSGVPAGDPDDGTGVDLLQSGGVSRTSAIGEELVVIDRIDSFETVLGSAGDDLFIIQDEGPLTNRPGGNPVSDDFFTFDLGDGEDAMDLRDESDVEVRVSSGAQDIVDPDGGPTDGRYIVLNNETYYAAQDPNNVINTEDVSEDVTIEYSAEEDLVDPLGQPVPVTGAFIRQEVRQTAAPNEVLANFIEAGAGFEWRDVTGGTFGETVIVTDNETAVTHNFNLGGGANVVDASAVTTQTDAVIESFGSTVDTSHLFNGDVVDADADSLTLIASLDSTTDLINATDTFGEAGAGSQVVIDLAAGTFEEFDDEGVSLNEIGVENFENVTTGDSDDTITGNTAANVINTGGGDDTVSGGGGDDDIDGTTGNKNFSGGAGNDTIDVLSATGDESVLNGDAGDDILTGGDGVQLFFGGADTDTINMGDADASVDRLTYDAANAADSQGATADTVTGFATGEDQVWILTDDASNLSGVASLLGGATTIAVDLGDDLALGGAGADADELVDVNDGGVIADGDVVLRIDQSAGADLQSLATPHIAHIVYDEVSDSQLGGRDEFDEFELGADLFDLTGLGLTGTDYDVAPDGLQLDEVLKIAIPVSVDNASSLPGFFAADPTQNPDAEAAGDSVLFVLQNEQGTANYRFFVDANQDGDFNAADDMVFDITNEPGGVPANVAAIEAYFGTGEITDLFLGVGS